MIADLSEQIAALSTEYQKARRTTYTYDGIPYTDTQIVGTVLGMIQPLDYIDREEIVGLGYSTEGTVKFYLPVLTYQTSLADGDIIIDTDGVNWKVMPKEKSYKHLGGYIKYILTKDVV